MIIPDVLILISETPAERGIFEEKQEERREVFCTIKSVGMREAYEAMGAGFHPEKVFRLAHAFEYQDEKRCEYKGIEYRIIRTYVTDDNGIEITAERGNQVCTRNS